MAEIPEMSVHFTVEGVETVCDMIGYLKNKNDELLRSLTTVQTVSTEQLERIRALEEELAQWRTGGVTEELLRKQDGFIKVGRGCMLVREDELAEKDTEMKRVKEILEHHG